MAKREERGEWVPVWREAVAPTAAVAGRTCRGCQQPASVLHSIDPEIRREYCGECQGQANRRRS
jgi:hypothetical protein